MAEFADRHSRGPAVMEFIQTLVLAVNLVWTTLCLGGYRPETMVGTSGLTGAMLLLHLAGRAAFAEAGGRTHPAGGVFLPFLAYAAAHVIWLTPVSWLGRHDWLWWAQLIAVFWVVLNTSHTRWQVRLLLGTLALTGFIAVVLAAYQIFVQPDWLMLGRQQAEQFIGRASGSFGIPNSLAALLLLLLPPATALALRRGAGAVERILGGYLAGVFLFGLVLTASRGAWIALALVLLAWPWLADGRSWRWRLRRQALTLTLLLIAGATAYLTMPTLRNRFVSMIEEAGERTRPIMWRGAWQLFREHPWWGSGAGSYNVAFEKHRPAHFQMDSQWAHNDYLNTLSDYGAVGFVLFFGAVGVVLAACRRASRRRTGTGLRHAWEDDPRFWQAVALGLLAFALQLFVDFHLKIPALAMALAIMAGLSVRHGWRPAAGETRRPAGARILHGAAGGALLVAMVTVVLPHYRAEASRYAARQAMDKLAERETEDYRAVLEPLIGRLHQAVRIDPGNAQAWSDLSYGTSLWAHVEPRRNRALGREAEEYADRALQLTVLPPEFWLRRAVAQDMQGRWIDAGSSVIEALRLAPNLALVWYHQAYHLSLNPVTLAQARSALAICLRLDPGNRPAQRLRQQLAAGDH